LVVLGLFALFTYAGIRIALRTKDPFVRLVASGSAVWIAGQALINIGYVTALLPVTGIPLPFISNGGTSLVLTCGVLGMLVSFARHEPAAVKAAQRAAGKGATARWLKWLRLGTPRTVEVAPRAQPARPAKNAPPARPNQPRRATPPHRGTTSPHRGTTPPPRGTTPPPRGAASVHRQMAPPPAARLRPTGSDGSGRRG
jgi:cell division protein FtsW